MSHGVHETGEAWFRRLAENAPDMIYRYRLEPVPGFAYVSPAASRLTGLSPAVFYADPEAMWRLVHPEDRSKLDAAWADPTDDPVEVRLLRADGRLVWTEHRLVAVRDGRGALVAVDGIARDISLRKRAEDEIRLLQVELQEAIRSRDQMMAELERQNQQLQALILNMAEGVVAVDETGRLLIVNPAATSLLGQPGPFDGQRVDEADFPEPLVQAIHYAYRSGGAGPVQARFVCGGAEIRALVSPIVREPGQVYGAVALLQDVTAEDRLKRLRENFVANVSHELRGPLAALSAGVEAIHDGLIPPEARPRYLKAMLAEIGRLRRLTDSLLELSRLDAGMVQIPIEAFDLAPLAEALLETWEPRAAAAGLQLLLECPPLRVMGNVDRVEEVLANFLDNAIRHTGPGGRIRLFARPEGEMVRIGVEDTGAGIDPAHLPHIWERFYKTDPARTRTPDRGTGLGLSICKQLVELMGGQVDVQSAPGVGSTFSFTLVAAR